MRNIEYTPKALEDLQRIKLYIVENFGVETAQKTVGKITAGIRRLEEYPLSGVALRKMFDVPTDYMYIFIERNYVFYRIQGNLIKIIRVLNERQDFMDLVFKARN